MNSNPSSDESPNLAGESSGSVKTSELESGPRFPNPSSESRGLMNSYVCGCQVRRDASGGYFIHACALHNAAPALYEALKDLLPNYDISADGECKFCGRLYYYKDIPSGYICTSDDCSAFVARAALALVNTQETNTAKAGTTDQG